MKTWLFIAAALLIGYAVGLGAAKRLSGTDHIQIYPVGAYCYDATYDRGDGGTVTFVCSKAYKGPMLSMVGKLVRNTDSCPSPEDGDLSHVVCKDGISVVAGSE